MRFRLEGILRCPPLFDRHQWAVPLYGAVNAHRVKLFGDFFLNSSTLPSQIISIGIRNVSLSMLSGAVATGNCYATGPGVGTASAPKTVPAGTQSTFSINARDVYKNVAADDNLNFQVKLTLLGKTTAYLNSDSITFADDHYEVDYTPVKAGTYSVSLTGPVCFLQWMFSSCCKCLFCTLLLQWKAFVGCNVKYFTAPVFGTGTS
jgi:hypothetical protein